MFPERLSHPALYTSLTLKGCGDNTVAVVADDEEETAVESAAVAWLIAELEKLLKYAND